MLRARCPLSRLAVALSTSASELPVIRLPRSTEKLLEKRGSKNEPVPAPRAGKLLISTRRRELNHFSREICGRWEQPSLVSRGWKHREAHGDYFTITRQRDERPWPETEHSFQSLQLDGRVMAAVQALEVCRPTWVQSQVIPLLLQGRNVLCASETGSGKTLAYLIPILHALLTQPGDPAPAAPRSLILVPSRELADQVSSVAGRLAASAGLTVRSLGGGRGRKAIEKQLRDVSIDLLVATPGALCKALTWGALGLSDVRFLVLDEADTLFDNTFSEPVQRILAHIHIASSPRDVRSAYGKAQLAIVGATFPRQVGLLLGKMTDLGSIETVKSKRLHCLMPHVQQTFRRVKGADKISELLDLLKRQQSGKSPSGVLVFCNTSKTVNWLGYILDDHRVEHSRLHGQMPADMRAGIFEAFQEGRSPVLICTDIASRGLDSCRVETVVNYDFPPTLEDYLHRAGRVGRIGSAFQGTVVSFVTHAWDVELVQKIEVSARKRSSLPGMESRIKEPVAASDLLKADGEDVD